MLKESQSRSYPSINSGPHFAFLSELLGGWVASQSHLLGSALVTYTSLFVKLPHM